MNANTPSDPDTLDQAELSEDSSASDQQEAHEADPYARPMSERQRRRLAEQQRLAEERASEADRPTNVWLSPITDVADAPPATTTDKSPTVTKTKTKTKATKQKAARTQGAGSAYLVAGLGSALWAGGIASWVAYEYGSGMIDLDPVRVAVYGLIATAPIGMAFLMAHIARLGAGIAAESRRARELAEGMVAPTVYAAQESGGILSILRQDIENANQVAERARNELAQLREALASEAGRIGDAARVAQSSTQNITLLLGNERSKLDALGQTLDKRATDVTDAVNRQAQMVVEASDLAQAQLREAEAALAARAADLAAAASEAQDAARVASEDLSRQTQRLETAGSSVTDQIKAVEDGLSQQRASLATAAYALRTDQEDFAAQIEGQRTQFIEQLSLSRVAAGELNATGDQIAEALKQQVEAVIDQFRNLVSMSQREADEFDGATRVSIEKFEQLATETRHLLLDETQRAINTLHATSSEQRRLAEEALQQAQIRADRLGESLFDAARQADDAAEARIESVRRIVGETLQMVDQTGTEAASRLENLTYRLTDALNRIESSVREMDDRAARMPEEAAHRVEAVRQTVEQGLASLSDASRRAAADTEALDAGFQERVRRNYEMLTEAVRLMDVVSPEPAPSQPVAAPAPTPLPPREEKRAVPVEPVAAPARQSIADSGLSWNDVAPRPAPAREPAPQQEPVRIEPPRAEPVIPLAQLIDMATNTIRRMGVDPNALLPRARIEDAAYALSRQDVTRARQIVRRVAPAAVRGVTRRLQSDTQLTSDISSFVIRYGQSILESGADQDAILTRLATDEGRAFMLFDAALGEMA